MTPSRLHLARALRLTLGLLLTPLAASAQAPTQAAEDEEPVRSVSVDLNGDGKKDAATLDWKEGAATYTLQVGKSRLKGRGDEGYVGELTVVDLDKGDAFKELRVDVEMEWDERRVDLYGFDGKQLKLLGILHKPIQAHGNGVVLSDEWRGFWSQRDKYVLNREQWRLDLVPQPFYYVGDEIRVTASFPLLFSPKGKDVVAQLAANTKIRVLAADPSVSDKQSWFLVKSSTGLVGWVASESLTRNTEGLLFSDSAPSP